MRSSLTINVVSAHAEGEVGDVIVGGVMPPPGETLWQQSQFLMQDKTLRNFLLNEPRGGVFRHVNLIVPAKNPRAQAGFIIMEPEYNPPMSGSNSICVATVLLESGMIPMIEPLTEFLLEAPGGLVPVRAQCHQGKVELVTVQNLPSFAIYFDAPLHVEGLGTLAVDTAFGGDSFVVVDAQYFGFSLVASEAAQLARTGKRIIEAANQQIPFHHPHFPGWTHYSFCLFAGQAEKTSEGITARSAVAIRPGKIDRSPTGTAVCARMAIFNARGMMNVGEHFVAQSLINSKFIGQIKGMTDVGGHPAIVPEVSGRAWITGTHQHMLDPFDPWPQGYQLSDTWGVN